MKVLPSICQKFGKLSSGHRTGKGQFSFQSQRKAMPKNVHTTTQLHSSHMSKVRLKILQVRLQQYVNHELADVQAGIRKGRGTRDQMANIHWIMKKQESSRKTSTSSLLLLYFFFFSTFSFFSNAKAFDCVDHNKLWKILQEMGVPEQLTCLLRNLYAG